ncbi:hypothetical protein [Enterococcus faecium]
MSEYRTYLELKKQRFKCKSCQKNIRSGYLCC